MTETLESRAREFWRKSDGKYEGASIAKVMADFASVETHQQQWVFLKWLRERPVAPHPIDRMNNLEKFLREDHEGELVALRAALRVAKEALAPFKTLADEIEVCVAEFPPNDVAHSPDSWAKSCQWHDLVAARSALAQIEEALK